MTVCQADCYEFCRTAQAQLKAADELAAAWERLRHYVGHHDGCPELRAGKCSCGVHERIIALNTAKKAYLRLREPQAQPTAFQKLMQDVGRDKFDPVAAGAGAREEAARDGVEIYSREECAFNYCASPDLCRSADRCISNPDKQGTGRMTSFNLRAGCHVEVRCATCGYLSSGGSQEEAAVAHALHLRTHEAQPAIPQGAQELATCQVQVPRSNRCPLRNAHAGPHLATESVWRRAGLPGECAEEVTVWDDCGAPMPCATHPRVFCNAITGWDEDPYENIECGYPVPCALHPKENA